MISLFMHGGPSHVDLLDPKPELTKHHGKDYGGDVDLQLRQPRQQEAVRQPVEVRQARPVRHRGVRAAAAHRRDRGRPLRDPLDAHRAQRARGLDPLLPRRHRRASPAGRRWGAGSSTAWAASRRTCRRTWCCPTPAGTRWTARTTGRAGSCRRSTRGRCCGRRSRASSTSTRRRTCAATSQRAEPRLARRAEPPPPATAPGRGRPGGPDRQLRAGRGDADRREGGARRLAASRSTIQRHVRPGPGRRRREYGTRCLIARRLVERGRAVRAALPRRPAVGQPQQHQQDAARRSAAAPTSPAAALVKDLKQRGLLDTTLVHWGGEIGRLPVCEGDLDDSAGPRPQRPGLLDLAGRRRDQGRDDLRRDRRGRPQGGRERRHARTTSRRRSCTCSAWTTRGWSTTPTAAPSG